MNTNKKTAKIIVSPAISHLRVISNELILALWLIVKGFNSTVLASVSTKGGKK